VKLIIGLGNPGTKYERTRHNIGFRVVDRLAQQTETPLSESICDAIVGRGFFDGEKIVLARPQTYMNRSGDCAQALLREFQIDPADMIVIYDDLDLPFGRIRIRAQGSAGGHRGIQSILDGIGGAPFIRVRLGIGRPPEGVDAAAFVLEPLTAEAVKVFDEVIARGADAVSSILKDGTERAMENFNRAS
jgi:PTH1 family peptidyl-tRNA hydrolase